MLIAFCGGLAFVLVEVFDIDPLTAYLATSPGGADSVAIIAASSNVDVSFVMAMQTVRLIAVLFIGPSLTKFVVKRIGGVEVSRSRRQNVAAHLEGNSGALSEPRW